MLVLPRNYQTSVSKFHMNNADPNGIGGEGTDALRAETPGAL